MTTTHEPDRVHELEAKVAELTALVERLAPADVAAVVETAEEAPRSSRRGMLKLAGAVAAGAAATVVVKGGEVAANTGNNLVIGGSNTATDVNEDVTYLTGPFQAQTTTTLSTYANHTGVNVGWQWTNTSSTTIAHAGVFGVATRFPLLPLGTASGHGVIGLAGDNTTGSGVYANSTSTASAGTSPGLRARSTNGPAIQLVPVATGVPTTGTWARGAIQPDTSGALWYCTAAGTPGTWINLAAPPPTPPTLPSGSLFHPITPTRVYDSRSASPSQGALGSGGNKTISIKDGRSLSTGDVLTADVVPVGATSITANVTVVNTVAGGFLAVNPGGNTTVSAATINWYGSGQILNNGVTLTINAGREVTVICGGDTGAQTDFVIDVTGYFV